MTESLIFIMACLVAEVYCKDYHFMLEEDVSKSQFTCDALIRNKG